MAMAYWDALAAILDACGDDAEEFDAAMASQLLAGTATALFWCPPALAINLRLQAAVVKCLEIPPQVRGLSERPGWLSMSGGDAAWSVVCCVLLHRCAVHGRAQLMHAY